MAALPRAALKRLQRDLKQLQREPLVGANAEPTEDDLSLWNGVVLIPLQVGGKEVSAPLHFRIDFPAEYPNKAPDVGFSTDFQFRMGASYTQPSGRLAGCKVVCLDLLGNFAHVHTEWAASEGSGWSPAYGVSTLLVNLQSVLLGIGPSLGEGERRNMLRRCQDFARAHPDAVPAVASAAEVAARARAQGLERRLAPMLGSNSDAVVAAAVAFARATGVLDNEKQLDQLVALLAAAAGTSGGGGGGGGAAAAGEGKGAEGAAGAGAGEAKAPPADVVDTNIVCYSTGTLYTEGMLGYGISVEQRGRQVNLSTPAELLSAQAYDDGLRQSTSKAAFEHFLPAFINPAHASGNPAWVKRLSKVVMQLGRLYGCGPSLAEAALAVFPKLINTMLAEIMSPETPKSAAIAYFEALLSFWRTFHFVLTRDKLALSHCRAKLRGFVDDEKQRLKGATPDVGALFALYACCPSGAPPFADFVAAYVDEAFLRSVLWWHRNRTPLESRAVFEATAVGRNIAMFQSLFVKQLIGPDPARAAARMDASNGKLPDKLEALQGFWRRHLKETTSWPVYFRRLGLDAATGKPICADVNGWVRRLVQRAEARGPAYGGRRGGGGSGGGGGGGGGGYRKRR